MYKATLPPYLPRLFLSIILFGKTILLIFLLFIFDNLLHLHEIAMYLVL